MSQKLIDQIVDRLRHARRLYYSGAQTSMTDAQYDALEDRLRELDPDNAFFRGVGFAASDAFEKVTHTVPMTSLNKIQTEDELRTWLGGYPDKCGLVISEKLDGISVSLRYQQGKLVRAATRGDGEVGEDITRNVVKMKGIQAELPLSYTGHIRGEIVLLRSDWQAHFPTYVNPRNAASGIAKRLDGEGSEYLTVMCYQSIPDQLWRSYYPNKDDELDEIQRLGLRTPWWSLSVPELVMYHYNRYLSEARGALDYDIDGLVVELRSWHDMQAAGQRDHRPEGARAFKFPHDEAVTTLRSVEWQVGVTGRVTPVAKFDTVYLAGANISQATLNNVVYIRDDLGGLRLGDQITVSRRNDVIPCVEGVVMPGEGPEVLGPTECPCCGQQLQVDGRYTLCINDDCPAQVAGGIRRWCERLELKGWGPALINALCEAGWISDGADLYALDADHLAELDMAGRKVGDTAYIVMSELRTKTEVTLDVLVGSMGIKGIGRSMIRMLMAAGYDTLEKLEVLTFEDIAGRPKSVTNEYYDYEAGATVEFEDTVFEGGIPNFGPNRAYNFVTGLPHKMPIIRRLLAAGVRLKTKSATAGVLSGKTVCCTGFRDKDLVAAVEAAGGMMKDSVGKGLTYLVAKDASGGSSKLQKAREQGTLVVSIDEMWAVIRG